MQISGMGKSSETEKSNLKKYILIALIVSVVLLIIVLICIVLFSSMTPKRLSLIIDGEKKNISESELNNIFVFENNNVYVSLRDVADLIGYRYYRGIYGGTQQYTEDTTKCYMQCDEEVVTYELTKDRIYKTPISDTVQYSEFYIMEPVKRFNNKLYVISSGLAKGCNLAFGYNQDTKEIKINTLPYLYAQYNDKATAGEYSNVEALSEVFDNKKAILYGMLVVKSGTKYGVITLDGKEVYIGTKYEDMQFIENAQEFLVKANQKYGVITKDGTTKIGIDYSKIELLDNVNGLYYVENAQKQKGVLNRNGKILGNNLYVEFDEIGVNTLYFPSDDIKNPKLLYDNCIPVKKDGKWAIYDTTGQLVTDFKWDGFGYIYSTSNADKSENILLIEDISGIVVSQNNRYGVINSSGKLIVPCVYDKIYSEVAGGEKNYYIQFNGGTTELKEFLKNTGSSKHTDNKENEEDDSGVVDLDSTKPKPTQTPTPQMVPTREPTPMPTPEINENYDSEETQQEEMENNE